MNNFEGNGVDKKTKVNFLLEAKRIGDRMLSEGKTDRNGLYWLRLVMDVSGNITWSASTSLYSGTPGIALFYLELYNETHEGQYLDAAKEAMRWVGNYFKNNPIESWAFYDGAMGASYVLIKLFQITKDDQYIKTGLASRHRKKPKILSDYS